MEMLGGRAAICGGRQADAARAVRLPAGPPGQAHVHPTCATPPNRASAGTPEPARRIGLPKRRSPRGQRDRSP